MKQSDRVSPSCVFMKQSDITSPCFGFYSTEWQNFTLFLSRDKVTELRVEFMSRGKVTELCVEFMSRGRLSETYFVVNDQLQPIMLQFWLTYIRCLGDGYKSEHDWYMLSLGVSGHVCFVIFVYQSRLSVDPAGRICFWRSSQFLFSRFP